MSERRKLVTGPIEENRAFAEDRINSGIEANRKGFAGLVIKDAEGKPLQGVKVTLNQRTHDFKFGANIFMLDELETPEKNAKYKEAFAKLFNFATLPFYWEDLEPEPGKVRFSKDSVKIYRRPAIDLCLEWCRENHIAPKLHCLNYDHWTPGWVPNGTADVKRLLDKRMKEIGERYSSEIYPIEVINETLLPEVHDFPLSTRHSTLFFREPDLVEWSFEHARKYFPANELIMNECTEQVWTRDAFRWNRSNYYMQIERALRKGAPIDGIGMQFHMFFKREIEPKMAQDLYDPTQLYRVMDQYANFGKPLSVTEVTVPAYSLDEEDEALQAEIAVLLYKIWFSHPLMEHIVYWNFADGYAAFAPQGDMTCGDNYYYGSLLRFDMSEKPVYKALYHLIHEEWHTALAEETCECGRLDFKGFYGEYDVTLEKDGKCVKTTLHLAKGADNRFEFIL